MCQRDEKDWPDNNGRLPTPVHSFYYDEGNNCDARNADEDSKGNRYILWEWRGKQQKAIDIEKHDERGYCYHRKYLCNNKDGCAEKTFDDLINQ